MSEENKEFVAPETIRTQRLFHYQNSADGSRLNFGLWSNPNQVAEFIGFLKQAQVDVEAFLDSTVTGDNRQ